MANSSANITKVNPAKVVAAGNNISKDAKNYQDQIKKIYATVSDLKIKWTGAAATQFIDKINSYKDDYENFGKLLDDFGKLLNEVGTAYNKLESNLKF